MGQFAFATTTLPRSRSPMMPNGGVGVYNAASAANYTIAFNTLGRNKVD